VHRSDRTYYVRQQKTSLQKNKLKSSDAIRCIVTNYNQGGDDNEDVTVLPDHLFVRLSLTEDEERQNKETLRPWVDPHNLREVNGVWWKEGRRVVTGDLAYR
jgi:hypothetical protein